jgi:hypothetical protein
MATIHTIDQKKQADRRTALLGLVADQPAAAGVCPTSVEMAELVENMVTPEKKELLFQHIAVCESCYREWLTLREVLDQRFEGKKRLKIFTFFRPGKALFGALLAAAASVVVFLNINHPVTTSPPVPVESFRQTPAPLLREEEKSRPILQDKGILPALKKSALKPDTLGKKQEMPVLPNAVKVRKSAPAAPAAMAPAPVSDLKEGLPVQESNAAGTPKASGEAVTEDTLHPQMGGRRAMLRQNRLQGRAAVFGQWREELENGCRVGQTSEAFWQEMEQKGREVKARSVDLSPDEQKTLKNLLLIIGNDKADVPERCRRINDLLAEERKGK